jgi:polysaccharide chain length determinant protein (PEP-CTERM system associated)
MSHPLDARMARLEEALDQMLLRYTERHPDVVSTRALLSDLKVQRDKGTGASRPRDGGATSRGQIENPLFQQLQVAMGAAEAEVSALQARVEEYKRRQEELGRMVDASLQVESEMGRLDRTHNVDKGNYQELVERREALRMAEEANKSSDMLKLKVVEPPRVPSSPSSPQRVLLNVGVLFAGFAAGTALAWLLGMLRPSVYSREGLLAFTDVPVLGTVSRIFSSEEVREHRVRIALFAAGCVALIAIFGTTIVLEPQLMGLVSKLRDLGANLV